MMIKEYRHLIKLQHFYMVLILLWFVKMKCCQKISSWIKWYVTNKSDTLLIKDDLETKLDLKFRNLELLLHRDILFTDDK